MASTASDEASDTRHDPTMAVVNHPLRRSKIHFRGNSRTIIVPRSLGVEAGESICLWRGHLDHECVYLKAVRQGMTPGIDTPNEAAVAEELCGVLQVRDLGDDNGLTVMAECDRSRYAEGTYPLLVAGRAEPTDECLYLLVIPETVVTDPSLMSRVVN